MSIFMDIMAQTHTYCNGSGNDHSVSLNPYSRARFNRITECDCRVCVNHSNCRGFRQPDFLSENYKRNAARCPTFNISVVHLSFLKRANGEEKMHNTEKETKEKSCPGPRHTSENRLQSKIS